jgi:hypothetical protein
MQAGAEPFATPLVDGRLGPVQAGRARRECCHATPLEGMNGLAHRLGVAVVAAGNRGRVLHARTGEQHLAAA